MASASRELVVQGIGVSPGVVIGPAFPITHAELRVPERAIEEDEIPREIARFEEAIVATRDQLRQIQGKVEKALDRGNASIFDAHLLILDDRSFIEDVIRGLKNLRVNVEAVLKGVAETYAAALAKLGDEYLRERAADVKDVARRIVLNLAGQSFSALSGAAEPSVAIAADLSPSDTATLNRDRVIGFATDQGSPTSHTAIMARALEIPAVVGLHDASVRISSGDRILVDGNTGRIVIRPSAETLARYGAIVRARESIRSRLETLRDEPARTLDGYEIELAGNIELPQDVDAVLRHGARGVGLFRSEFLFLSRAHLPDEMEQARAYAEVARRLAPAPVVIRTLDLGGDKFASSIAMPQELNPHMGWRAIRFCLAQPDIFSAQLRAILRASAQGNVKIMYPMVGNVDEVIHANRILDRAKEDLAAEGAPFDEAIEVGIMVEVPSAALNAHQLARRVKFFSIGTNDLIQYTLAVDRINEQVAYLYEPTHPAILHLLRQTIDAARSSGIWSGVCGEMAANPLLTPLLVGLGVDELSVSPNMAPMVKQVIRGVTLSECAALAARSLQCESAAEVAALCRELTQRRAPEIVDLLG